MTRENLIMAKSLDANYDFDKEIKKLVPLRARHCELYKMILNDYGVDLDPDNNQST